ncbi:Protein LBH [Bagarius yarrelli]|uniref:Protein LBH n=1 Tax=Bagarius yarrelli TaxID=175774 RepID=A0A556V509_BAGYA|nr:Protein LBH [Bagarius yarrelli]
MKLNKDSIIDSVRFRPPGYNADNSDIQPQQMGNNASSVFVPCREMTDVMISSTPVEDIRLSPSKDRLTFQIFPDPSDFERCCKLKDRLPSIVVEATEGEVESGELRWPPEEFLNSQDEGDEEEDEDELEEDGNVMRVKGFSVSLKVLSVNRL